MDHNPPAVSLEPNPFDRYPTERRAWWRPVALGLSCLVVGLVVGYLVRGGGEGAQVRPVDPADRAAATESAPVTVTAPDAPVPPPPRGRVQVAVLNGTDIAGFAARTADQAEAAGYVDVIAEDAPEPNAGASAVHFREGQRPAGLRLARDLGLAAGAVSPLPANGPLASGAPPGAGVVVVLGPV